MKNQTDVITDWDRHHLWEDISIVNGQQRIDLHPRADGPHVFFFSDSHTRRTEFLAGTLQLFAAKYGPAELNIYGIDPQKGPVSQALKELPHCVGITEDPDQIALAFSAIKQEMVRRQKLLGDDYQDAYQYLRAAEAGAVSEPMPLLFIAIADLDCIIGDRVLLRQMLASLMIARSFGIHFLLTGGEDDLVETLPYYIRLEIDLDLEDIPTAPPGIRFADRPRVPQLEDQVRRIWQIRSDSGEEKTLELVNGNLCQLQKSCDVVVCSASVNNYYPSQGTLIASLARKGIWVDRLAMDPELDLKKMGCWLSRDTGSPYRRIACVELLDIYTAADPDSHEIILKKSFSTLRYLLEQAQILGLPVETVALPILGSGHQGLEPEYVLSTLVCQCRQILLTNAGVKKLVFYEINHGKYEIAEKVLEKTFSEEPAASPPKVFISYSSKQSELAYIIRDQLEKQSIPCWMAPDSIPPGADYVVEIPTALSQIDIVLIILTPDAAQSRWVRKEVGTAIGANKAVLPYQVTAFTVDPSFRFLLDGEQILADYANPDPSHQRLIQAVLKILSAK